MLDPQEVSHVDKRDRTPHKKHILPRLPKPEPYHVTMDGPEGVTAAARGYFPGSNYSAEEREFMAAVVQWQRRHKSKFLTHTAYLKIALELGYTRRPTPPTPPTPMNAHQILTQMVNTGFRFSRGLDGTPTFHPPADTSTPERQNLLCVLAWSWCWLVDHVGPFLDAPAPGASARPAG